MILASRRLADRQRFSSPVRRVSLTVVGDGPGDLPSFGDDAPEVWRDSEGVVCAWGGVIDGCGWMEIPQVGLFRCRPSQNDVTAFAADNVSDEVLLDCYWRIVLPHALQLSGCEVLHASAVRTETGVVAFCAVSGTGKSTTVAALTRRGHPFWADDAVVFENHEGGAQAVALPCRMRLSSEACAYLGFRDTPSEWVRAGEADAPLTALCVLQRDVDARDGVEIRRLTNSGAVTSVLPHGYCFSTAGPERKRRMIEQYLDLAASTPIYQIAFAPGFDRLETMLDRIETEIPFLAPVSR